MEPDVRGRRHTSPQGPRGVGGGPSEAGSRAVRIDTYPVDTYYVSMNVTLAVDDRVMAEARRRAEAMGTSVNQLVREYLEQLVGKSDSNADAWEFERLSLATQGNSGGWKFNREELHERP